MLSRVIFGTRATLMLGLVGVIVGGLFGGVLGILAAYYRRLDGWIMRLVDVMLAFPAILIGLAVAAIFGAGLTAVVIALVVATVPDVARVARGAAVGVMGQEFMEAGRAVGVTDGALIWRYLTLNCISTIFVFLTLALRPDHPDRLGARLPRHGRATADRRTRHDGGAGPRLPVHGAAHRDHPELRDLRDRAGRQPSGRRVPRRPRSEAADMIRTVLGVALAIGVAGSASAQTLTMMKGIDAPHYDAQRTTWGPTSDIVNMFQDTLVALDWDGRTPIPYLAKSWTISEDGRTYTFKLRDDVSFCSGKKFTAEDVVYSFKRLKDPAIKGPYAWRAGNIKELRAPDPYTVEYELEEPFSELLLQLTMFTNVIHNKESVEALGKDYGIKGADGTGPWCFESWQPRTEIVLKRHDAYKWGPSMYKNKGPVKFEKLVIKIVPEDSSRVAAMMAGQFDITHQFPSQFIAQAKAAPMLTVTEAKPNFQLLYFGFKTTRPMVADRRVREAMSIAINRAEIAKAILLGNADPAFTFVDKDALDHDPKTERHRQGRPRARQETARRSRLEAGRRRRPREGRREAGAESLLHGQRQLGPGRRRDPGLSPQDRRRLAAQPVGLDHLVGQDGRAGL